MSDRAQFVYTPQTWVAKIVNADASGLITLLTGATAGANGPGGSLVKSIMLSSDDTSAREIQLWVTISAVDYLLATTSAVIGAGNTNAVPSVNMLNRTNYPWLDDNGFLIVEASAVLKVKSTTTVTAAKTVYIIAMGGDLA